MLLALLTTLTLTVGNCQDVFEGLPDEALSVMACYAVHEPDETSPEDITELLAPYLTAEPEYEHVLVDDEPVGSPISVTLQVEVEGVAYEVFYHQVFFGLLVEVRQDE